MSEAALDFGAIPFLDNHAHPFTYLQPRTPDAWRANFTEASSAEMVREVVGSAVYYRWTVRQIAAVLGVPADEQAILDCRNGMQFNALARFMVQRGNVGAVLLDMGFPARTESFTREEMAQAVDVPVWPMLRIEVLAQDLIVQQPNFDSVVAAFDAQLEGARRDGYVALKSIAAYRTGLAVQRPDSRAARDAFDLIHPSARRTGTLRLAAKPLNDFFVWRTLEHAARLEMPVQFHTGYGDPDLDLLAANPLWLRTVFETERFRAVPIVLLHESFPYTAESAFLAAAYPNAFLDLAFSLPPLDRRMYRRVTETALGVAPSAKIMCSSDGTRIPEHFYLGAVRARQALRDVLNSMVENDELCTDDAEKIARDVLWNNAVRVYGLNLATLS